MAQNKEEEIQWFNRIENRMIYIGGPIAVFFSANDDPFGLILEVIKIPYTLIMAAYGLG